MRLRRFTAVVVLTVVVGAPSGGASAGGGATSTLEQQVGQLVVLSFSGTTVPLYVREALRERRAAGVILFGGNIVSAAQLRRLTADLRRGSWRPIVAVDQEGGSIRRVPWAGPVRSAAQQAAAGAVRLDAAAAARELREAGITVTFAPVADVPSVDAQRSPIPGVRLLAIPPS